MSKSFDELTSIMARLRAPGGCPWDREQTYASLSQYLLEEAYETFDAIHEALGDLACHRAQLFDLLRGEGRREDGAQVPVVGAMAAEEGRDLCCRLG